MVVKEHIDEIKYESYKDEILSSKKKFFHQVNFYIIK